VATFWHNARYTLYLFDHLRGKSKDKDKDKGNKGDDDDGNNGNDGDDGDGNDDGGDEAGREHTRALAGLLRTYRRCGLEIAAGEAPDYVPLFLEALGVIAQTDQAQAAALLGEMIDTLHTLGMHLRTSGNPYAGVFTALRYFSPIEPEALVITPECDMGKAS
jgi:nitrate reductase assembly molybdenum cofactor insertion protein NarJ